MTVDVLSPNLTPKLDNLPISLAETSTGAMMLSIVIPAFNESERLGRPLARLADSISKEFAGEPYELIVVDDGSTDSTTEVALQNGANKVVSYQGNRGKGYAVRRGMQVATGRSKLFCDADGSFSPGDTMRVLEPVIMGVADIAIGQRNHETTAHENRLRELGSRLLGNILEQALPTGFTDTQCGLKAFTSLAAEQTITLSKSNGFALDREILARAKELELRVAALPVAVEPMTGSKVRIVHDTVRMYQEIKALNKTLK